MARRTWVSAASGNSKKKAKAKPVSKEMNIKTKNSKAKSIQKEIDAAARAFANARLMTDSNATTLRNKAIV